MRNPLAKGDHHETLDQIHPRQALAQWQTRRRLDEQGEDDPDFLPVVKLFTPDAQCTWLLSELDPEGTDMAFGLCDLGMQCPELGYVRISELESVRGRLGLPVERDRFSEPKQHGSRMTITPECLSSTHRAR
ncbi:DUF2958 domain-containing protein [Oricola indica]|uniref:DUF2958 domain-containing protein n=1 Tax=Oricola indica TaxID=2872591 RepID=UPI003CCBEC96